MNVVSKKCLVVDDDEVTRMAASEMIRSLGLEVVEAYDGREAMEVCEREHPDVIMLDLYMPEMDGMDFLFKIRDIENKKILQAKDKFSVKRPIIIVCSSEDKSLKVGQTAHAGADDYMMKPYRIDSIREKFKDNGIF